MEKPEYALSFEERDRYLYAFVSGPKDSLQVGMAFFDEIYARVQELGVDRVLVEEDFPNQVSYEDMVRMAEYLGSLFIGVFKLAHVDRNAEDMDLNRLGAAVVLSKSLLGRVFDNIEDAEAWLVE